MRNWTFQPPAGTPINLQHPQAKGLVGMWMLNEGGGATVFDATGRGHHGTAGSTPTHVLSERGRVVDFDVGDYYGLGDVFDFSNTDLFTLTAWIEIDAFDATIIAKGSSSSPYQKWSLSIKSIGYEQVRLEMVDTSSNSLEVVSGFNSIVTGQWYHIAASYAGDGGANTKVYIDGVDDTVTVTGSISATTASSAETRIAGNVGGGTYNGRGSDVRIYNRVLTPSEVLDLYVNPYDIFNRRRTVGFVAAAPAGEAPPNFPWQSMMGYGA